MSNTENSPQVGGRFTLLTLARFFCGDWRAILIIANSPAALLLGFLFVISAGFAREYDGEYLLAEPWHIFIPLGASLATSFILYSMLYGVGYLSGLKAAPFLSGYRRFLILFWMTAPLAWLYAIPWERFCSAGDAMRFNLYLLALVAVYRVLLITRVASVFYRARFFSVFVVVMVFADAIALAAISVIPQPVISMMGGIRHSESEMVIFETTAVVVILGMITGPFWLIGVVLTVIATNESDGKKWSLPESSSTVLPSHFPVHWGCWVLALLAILIGIIALPGPQAEQRNRYEAMTLFEEGKGAEAIVFMSSKSQDEFPPHWDPPPYPGYEKHEPDIFEVILIVHTHDAADWVRDLYVEKYKRTTTSAHYGMYSTPTLDEMSDEQLAIYADFLKSLPNASEVAIRHQHDFYRTTDSEEKPATTDRQKRIQEILEMIEPAD